jgi:hypothetical protein
MGLDRLGFERARQLGVGDVRRHDDHTVHRVSYSRALQVARALIGKN